MIIKGGVCVGQRMIYKRVRLLPYLVWKLGLATWVFLLLPVVWVSDIQ